MNNINSAKEIEKLIDKKITNMGTSLNSKLTNFEAPTVAATKPGAAAYFVSAKDKIQPSDGLGGASDLTEDPDTPRTYHTSFTAQVSPSGLFVYKVNPLKTITFLDKNGKKVVFTYAATTNTQNAIPVLDI